MNIIVCVKQISHIYVHQAFDKITRQLTNTGVVHTLNPYDKVALEAALRLREQGLRKQDGEGGVTVISIGPKRVESALRWCLAMGADRAIHVVDDAAPDKDPWPIADLLARVIQSQDTGHDLVLCGRKAMDREMGQVGVFLAELLDLPVVTSVAALTVEPTSSKAMLQRSLERGNRETVECALPAVFTVDKNLHRPRYPTLPGRAQARKMAIERISLADIGGERISATLEVTTMAPPRIRPKKILSPDSNLSAANRLQFAMSGGMPQKKGGQIGGDPTAMAIGIFDFLKDRNFLPKPNRES